MEIGVAFTLIELTSYVTVPGSEGGEFRLIVFYIFFSISLPLYTETVHSLMLLLFCNLWDKVRISVLKFLQTSRPLSNAQEKKQLSYVKVAGSYERGKFMRLVYNLTLMHLWTRR